MNQQRSVKQAVGNARATPDEQSDNAGKVATSAVGRIPPAATDTGAPAAANSAQVPTRDELLAVAERVRGAFPHPPSEAELVLIDVDPRHLHAFWTVPFAWAQRLRERIGAEASLASMVLRVCAVDADGSALGDPFDIEVLGLQGQYYVDVWDAPRRYRATLGYRLGDGTLVPLAASGVAELPPTGRADDHTWREIALPPPTALVSMPAATPMPFAPPVAAATAGDRQQTELRHPDDRMAAASAIVALSQSAAGETETLATTATAPLAGERAVATPPALPPSPVPAEPTAQPAHQPVAGGQPPAAEATAAAPPRPPLPFPMPPFAPIGDRWDSGDSAEGDRPFWELPVAGPPADAAAGEPPHQAQPEMSAHEQPTAAEDASGDALEDTPGPAAVGEEGPPALPLPLENVLSLSSFVLGRDPVELEVNAELHVFGRVKPGSRLQLFGQEVRIRPDGTFSVHRPLGSGAAIMPVLMTDDEAADRPEATGDETSGEPG